MSTEIKKTQVDLSGLLDVLGKNLYSTPLVAIRELIQNAHDACIRRQIESSPVDHEIRITPLPSQQQLIIEDNGAGLTKSEIENYLATIGSGYTRVLRNNADNDMIGYFGLGFLSAYVVSDKVTLTTTSYQEPNNGWQFSSSGGMNYVIQAAKASHIGSKVTLQLSEQYAELTDAGLLTDVIQKYCCLLPIPIYLQQQTTALNTATVPWLLPEQTSALQYKKHSITFAQIFEDKYEPLTTIKIEPTDNCDVHGLLWIQGGSNYASSDQRNVTVFIRNMFITDDERELLPVWAGFIGCVINTTALTPTASREEIQQDQYYQQIQSHIERTLVSALAALSSTEPETWKRILSRHNEMLLGAAISDDSLYQALQTQLTVPTTEGDRTLERLTANHQDIHITLDETGSYDEILCKAMQIPIVLGYRFAAYPFCQRYAEIQHKTLVTLGTKAGNQKRFPMIDDDSLKETLSTLFLDPHEDIALTQLTPSYLPLLIIPDEDVALKQRIESDESQKRIGSAALSLATLFTDTINDDIRRTLYINIDAPLIQALLEQPTDKQKSLAIVLKTFATSIGRINHHTDERSLSDELKRYHDHLLTLF